jgi:hypothetical protein
MLIRISCLTKVIIQWMKLNLITLCLEINYKLESSFLMNIGPLRNLFANKSISINNLVTNNVTNYCVNYPDQKNKFLLKLKNKNKFKLKIGDWHK